MLLTDPRSPFRIISLALSCLLISSSAFTSYKHETITPILKQRSTTTMLQGRLQRTPYLFMTLTENDNDDEMEQMRKDIEEMRQEALKRIDALSSRVPSIPVSTTSTKKPTISSRRSIDRREQGSTSTAVMEQPTIDDTTVKARVGFPEEDHLTDRKVEKKAVSNTAPVSSQSSDFHDVYDLLDGTSWKILLNVGREPGTWMPKTWGVSGERLLMNLEIRFDAAQLYEREEFLGSAGGAKICHVVGNTVTLGPNMSEGSKSFKVMDGGWRIGRGEGPMGTDLLRFYVEMEDEVSHRGGDVYCPAGRIYCTCGYFPMNKAPDGKKLELRRKLDTLGKKHDDLQAQIDEEGFFSMKKVKMTRELFQISLDAQNLRRKLTEISVTDPDKSLLKYSRKRDVALTKEGGVCCKVKKGPVTTEYHILGKFGLGAVDHDH